MTIDKTKYRKLEAHEILREGDRYGDDLAGYTGYAGNSAGLCPANEYYRAIRPSVKPGYRWADAGEECKLYAPGDVRELSERNPICLDAQGREKDDAGGWTNADHGAVMPWPEDPRLAPAPEGSTPEAPTGKKPEVRGQRVVISPIYDETNADEGWTVTAFQFTPETPVLPDAAVWPKAPEYDPVHKPAHYDFGIEPMAAIFSWELNFARGCAVKYIARAGRKDASKELEALKKAREYLDREIKRMEGE